MTTSQSSLYLWLCRMSFNSRKTGWVILERGYRWRLSKKRWEKQVFASDPYCPYCHSAAPNATATPRIQCDSYPRPNSSAPGYNLAVSRKKTRFSITDKLVIQDEGRAINSASWERRGWFHMEMVRCLSSMLNKTSQWFHIYQLWSITTIGPKLLNAASQNVYLHRVEWVWLHQLDTNTTADTNGTPSSSSVLSAICLLTSTPRQPKAGCHLLEVEGWAGDRSRKNTCLRSFSDRNNYHIIIHWQCCVFFSFLFFCVLIN